MPSQATTQENSAAGVIPAAPWRIQALAVLPGHRLALTFRDGSNGIADCSAIKNATDAGIFAPLADETLFAQVSVELGVPTWPNGADLDPAWLHENLATKKTWSVPF